MPRHLLAVEHTKIRSLRERAGLSPQELAGKFTPAYQAADATVIVTNHHNFIQGKTVLNAHEWAGRLNSATLGTSVAVSLLR